MTGRIDIFRKLNSPVQKVTELNGVEVWMKREDLIHPHVSGNKWRKLKYFLQDFNESGKTSILTFGGAFSNHLAATAALGQLTGTATKALLRGEEVITNNTLDFCRSCGMEVEAIPRKRYELKDTPDFIKGMREMLPEVYLIPEGGKGPLGVKGCTEITEGLEKGFDIIACAGGTGTTMAGLLQGNYPADFWLFPALKGGIFLKRETARQAVAFEERFSTVANGKKRVNECLRIIENYHFGGYGKVKPELVDFMNEFHETYGIPLDPVYTGKMMFGLLDLVRKGEVKRGARVLAIHTGGLQGIKGMNERLKKSGLRINYEV